MIELHRDQWKLVPVMRSGGVVGYVFSAWAEERAGVPYRVWRKVEWQ